MEIISGIYKIENKINGHKYIGCSKNIYVRWQEHKKDSQQLDFPLYRAIRKYGIDNFTFEIVEKCNIELLYEKEKFWITFYNSYDDGYNATRGGESNPALHVSQKVAKEEIIFIRKCYNDLMPRHVVYELFKDKLSLSGFTKIWSGETWHEIMPEVFTEENRYYHRARLSDNRYKSFKSDINFNEGETNGKSKLKNEQIYDIIKLLRETKKSQREIAEMFHVHLNTINDINCCKTWTHLHNYKKNVRAGI
jgi:group I intron endonuclease